MAGRTTRALGALAAVGVLGLAVAWSVAARSRREPAPVVARGKAPELDREDDPAPEPTQAGAADDEEVEPAPTAAPVASAIDGGARRRRLRLSHTADPCLPAGEPSVP